MFQNVPENHVSLLAHRDSNPDFQSQKTSGAVRAALLACGWHVCRLFYASCVEICALAWYQMGQVYHLRTILQFQIFCSIVD